VSKKPKPKRDRRSRESIAAAQEKVRARLVEKHPHLALTGEVAPGSQHHMARVITMLQQHHAATGDGPLAVKEREKLHRRIGLVPRRFPLDEHPVFRLHSAFLATDPLPDEYDRFMRDHFLHAFHRVFHAVRLCELCFAPFATPTEQGRPGRYCSEKCREQAREPRDRHRRKLSAAEMVSRAGERLAEHLATCEQCRTEGTESCPDGERLYMADTDARNRIDEIARRRGEFVTETRDPATLAGDLDEPDEPIE
jgi:hypothetical protein